MKFVLDASAALAVLNREPGAEYVVQHLDTSVISTVNAVEVGTKLIDRGMSGDAACEAIAFLNIPVVEFDYALAERAVGLRLSTKHAGLSLADRACLALALREQATAVTADRAWADLDVGCPVELIR